MTDQEIREELQCVQRQLELLSLQISSIYSLVEDKKYEESLEIEPLLVTEQMPEPVNNHISHSSFSNVLVKKPVMYVYNMTGVVQAMSIDFKDNVVADSVPKVRLDNKLVFNLDQDSYINGKYDYLYYEFELNKDIPRSNCYAFVRNDKNLMDDLTKLANICNLQGKEASDFVTYWTLELKRDECKFYKVEIYDEDKLAKLFPLDIDPVPDLLIRRYFKFVPCDKMGKANLDTMKEIWKPRFGNIRCVEWGGWTAESKIVK